MSVTLHDDLESMLPAIQAIRDAISGSSTVKSKTYTYLPHPSQADKTSAQAKARYATYIGGAEWSGFPEQTERSMLGRLQVHNATIDLPTAIDYLKEDIDGDGLSLKGAMHQTAKNILEVKWHFLLADYAGLPELDLSNVSIEDLAALNARAKIKQYTRENVVNWSHERINGSARLTFVMLREVGTDFDPQTKTHSKVTSYLILAVDDIGYYQQKITETNDGAEVEGEKSYVMVGGQNLKWIPCEIVTDGENDAGSMPKETGFMGNICDLAYSRYRVSADYKEAMRNLPPTTYIQGMDEPAWKTFQEVNGRSYIATGAGAVNLMDSNVQVEIVGADTQLESYERYFENNKKEVQALGGVFKDDTGAAKTATEARQDNAEQTAVLNDIVSGLEAGFKRILAYCAMFEGIFAPDQVEQNLDQIKIAMVDDFNKSKLTVEEVKEIQNLYMSGLYTLRMAIDALIAGGWAEGDAEEIMNSLQDSITGGSASIQPGG